VLDIVDAWCNHEVFVADMFCKPVSPFLNFEERETHL